MKWIVAVDYAVSKTEVTAAAVVYPVHTHAPTFTYADRYGRRRVVGLKQYNRLSAVYRALILKHIKETALSWAVVSRTDRAGDMAMSLALGRALEKMAHKLGIVLDRNAVLVYVPGRHPLPEHTVGAMHQHTCRVKAQYPWYLLAASALANAEKTGRL